MGKQVLVAYATKHGATAEIAGRIGSVILQAGNIVQVKRVSEVEDLSAYDAVVLGSAVYMGSWRKEAARFLKSNESALAQKPVWLFSTGPTGKGDPKDLMDGWIFPKALHAVAERIAPRAIEVFHGAIDTGKLGGLERWILKRVQTAAGDFRDWSAIDEWATAIAKAI